MKLKREQQKQYEDQLQARTSITDQLEVRVFCVVNSLQIKKKIMLKEKILCYGRNHHKSKKLSCGNPAKNLFNVIITSGFKVKLG